MVDRASEESWRRLARWTAVGGFVIIAIYLALALPEGNNSRGSILLLALLMAVPAGMSLRASFSAHPRTGRTLLYIAAFLFAVLGWAALLSIGILFLAAALAALVGAARVAI